MGSGEKKVYMIHVYFGEGGAVPYFAVGGAEFYMRKGEDEGG